MGLFSRARTGTGRMVQVVGFVLWMTGALLTFVWTLYLLFSTFGVWTIFVGLLFAPVTYIASVFILWFSTGAFPLFLSAPYLFSFVGGGLLVAGGAIAGDKE